MDETRLAKLTVDHFNIMITCSFLFGVVCHMFLIYVGDFLQFAYKIFKKIKRFIRIRKLHRIKV